VDEEKCYNDIVRTTVNDDDNTVEAPKKCKILWKELLMYFYAFLTMSYFVITNDDLLRLHVNIYYNYTLPAYWYGVVIFEVLTSAPFLVLFFMRTPQDLYPATKQKLNDSKYKVICAGLFVPAFYMQTMTISMLFILYLYGFFTNGCKDITQTTVFISVLCATYLARSFFRRLYKILLYNWISDSIVIWKFMVDQIRGRRENSLQI
jgi:hypothetical protein